MVSVPLITSRVSFVPVPSTSVMPLVLGKVMNPCDATSVISIGVAPASTSLTRIAVPLALAKTIVLPKGDCDPGTESAGKSFTLTIVTSRETLFEAFAVSSNAVHVSVRVATSGVSERF